MNIKTLNEISSIVKQRTKGLFDISDWKMFIKERYTTSKWDNDGGITAETNLAFIQENEERDLCYIVTVVTHKNIIMENSIAMTQIFREGNNDYYSEIADVSGVDRTTIVFALN